MKSLLPVIAAAAGVLVSGPASAAADLTNRACGFADLAGVTVTACSGFYSGNLLKGNTGADADADVEAALTALGLTAPQASLASYIEKIPTLGGSTTSDFTTMLYGDVIVGHHLGGGAPVFDGLPDYSGKGGGTAFYRFDAGVNGVDLYTLNSLIAGGASSGAAIFQNGQPAPIPEASSIAMMLAGLAVLGVVRRRKV